MGGRFVCFELELGLCDFPVSIAVLVEEHVVDDAMGVKSRRQAAFALAHLTHDVVGELQKEKKYLKFYEKGAGGTN